MPCQLFHMSPCGRVRPPSLAYACASRRYVENDTVLPNAFVLLDTSAHFPAAASTDGIEQLDAALAFRSTVAEELFATLREAGEGLMGPELYDRVSWPRRPPPAHTGITLRPVDWTPAAESKFADACFLPCARMHNYLLRISHVPLRLRGLVALQKYCPTRLDEELRAGLESNANRDETAFLILK